MQNKETALPASELFSATIVTTHRLARRLLKQLFEAVQWIGKGCAGIHSGILGRSHWHHGSKFENAAAV
jgi:hypothetical protein